MEQLLDFLSLCPFGSLMALGMIFTLALWLMAERKRRNAEGKIIPLHMLQKKKKR